MFFYYFLIFVILGIIILKKLITKRKKIIMKKKIEYNEENVYKEVPITECIPYFKYTKNLKCDILTLNSGDKLKPSDIFYIEEGTISIYYNDQFVCKKQQNDFFVYALNFFSINLENLHIQVEEKSKIWKIDPSKINSFLLLTSIKKKVFEVLTDYLNFQEIIIEEEIRLTLFDSFKNQLVNKEQNTRTYSKGQYIKSKDELLKSMFFIEIGSFIVKDNNKEYIFKKGQYFGYFGLFFNCYRDIEIYSLESTTINILDYEYLVKNGYTIENFDIDILRRFGNIIYYIDICTDWRVYKINDIYKEDNNLKYINEGTVIKKDNIYIVKRLSDVISIKEDIILHLLRYDINLYKKIFNKKENYKHNKIISLVPSNKNTNINLFSKRLKSSIGKECLFLDKKDFYLSFDNIEELKIKEFLNRLSRLYSLLVIPLENKYSRLSKFLHNNSDIVLIIGYDYEVDNNINYKIENIQYVKLYESKITIKNRYKNLEHNYKKIHHILSPSKTILFSSVDYDRLGRYLLGRRIGLVLSGGGARGIAHIGVIQALEEEGIPIDIIGGSSMGAFIGALYCKECDNGFVFLKAKKFCANANSYIKIFFDLTYPLVSLFRGEVLNGGLKKIFKNDLIENLWLEYFCVSTNLFTSEEEIHTSGLVWKYIRASMGLCGYIPPIVDSKGYLVDGGYLNNVPADIMLNMNVSKIIAVDVGTIEDNDYDEHDECFNGFVGLVHKFLEVRKYITMEEIQYRLSFLTSEKKLKELEKNNKIFIMRPDLNNIKTMDFKKFDEIVASGYSSAKLIIENWKKEGIFEKHFDQKNFKKLKRRFSV